MQYQGNLEEEIKYSEIFRFLERQSNKERKHSRTNYTKSAALFEERAKLDMFITFVSFHCIKMNVLLSITRLKNY